MLEKILPPGFAVSESLADVADAELFPEEEAIVARAVDKRRREFATVRACAREALARLGLPAVPIVPGERGAPRWPAGVVGSMTHCEGYRAAALTRSGEVGSVGIDAEPHLPLPPGVLKAVTLEQERRMLARLAAQEPGTHWDRLLFSAKESAYKAWYPLAGTMLEFEEAEVVLDRDGTFTARFLAPGPLTGLTGRWQVCGRLLMTAAVTPGAPPGRTGSTSRPAVRTPPPRR
ncbi:4'-phosphopantetheinyl transferase family protein [Thermoactinospora rubra]|uniref:4'-phosphopantetheinyl transferase family protein n=1 Tax=Thermoactinospora rubra TaxID=1088767 RepID=UPI000A107D79|nr:4'-phosphopantetheinyl transferase superfamily protein [Thermoactinospora rubra]